MNDRGSDRLPLNCFHLQGPNASQLRAISGGPSTGRASRSCGTDAITTSASPATEEVHAPRTFPGVCASPRDSASGTSRSFFGQHSRVFTSGPTPENPPKRDSVVKVLEQVYYNEHEMSSINQPGDRPGGVLPATLLPRRNGFSSPG